VGIFSGFAGLALALPNLIRLINIWPWTANKYLQFRVYFALPPALAPHSFNRRDQLILLVAAILSQAIYLFIIPLVFECDAAMYFNYAKSLLGIEGGGYTYYRAPGFPVFLIATGQFLFDSFIGTVIVHAAIGVLMPILAYRSLAPINRCAAFICASVFILSGMPFLAAKLMLAEHLFAFLIVGMIYSFSRYYFSRDPRFIYLVIFLGIASMFVRWGGLIPLLLVSTTLAILAHKETGHVRHLVLALSVAVSVTGSFSYLRSQLLNEPALFGSLHNMTGRQMFYRVYSEIISSTMEWRQLLELPEPDDENILPDFYALHQYSPTKQARRLNQVTLTNGPATRRLNELVVTIATENPDGYRKLKPMLDKAHRWPEQPEQDYYQENFGRFEGNAEVMAENFFDHPSVFYADYISSELNLKLGIAQTDALLKKVVVEAVWAHPVVLMSMVTQGASFFGVDFKKLVHLLQGYPSKSPIMAIVGDTIYSKGGIDTTGCVASTLPPEMQTENLQDQLITLPLTKSTVFMVSTAMRNLIRNTVGTIALFTWWFIPLSRHRGFFIFIAASALALVAVVSVAGTGGANSRYEIVVFPLILMATTGAILTLWEFFQKLGTGHPNTPKP
jgi:hypothetical protein